ncbi:hypothetical protein QFW96_22325 [Saccharopolyspora sp. TS4A08]|uniref:Uncharacterized protein n=1 Tax=Saccharopolyspora ipomoeae TaxID=3042027 RepID=A0ABT6PTP8_9PSEU|nr:hypothetical protein [Saccharopolyspora sp. TS4A08]MDI2031381.1 hypothetical protein [Saccharopolyspora sp. TS4A08]
MFEPAGRIAATSPFSTRRIKSLVYAGEPSVAGHVTDTREAFPERFAARGPRRGRRRVPAAQVAVR